MVADKAISNVSSRQRIVAGVVIVVILFLLWQAKGLFSSGNKGPMPDAVTKPVANASQAGFAPRNSAQQPGASQQMQGPPGASPQNAGVPGIPQQAAVPAAPLTQREAELMRLQQETEAKYIAALNELQLLKVDREIAETNKAIAAAKLDMVTAQKGIVDLLSPQPVKQTLPPGIMRGVPTAEQSAAPGAAPTTPTPAIKEVTYSVVSVTQLQYRWNAVLSSDNNLYSVHVGDILPADGSKVISINKSGVVLEKEGKKKRISMVPVI